jgi:hypothetical protein
MIFAFSQKIEKCVFASTLLLFISFAEPRLLCNLMSRVNNELKNWAAWFRANTMVVNTKKTKYIIFHSKGKKVETNGINIIYDDNEQGL